MINVIIVSILIAAVVFGSFITIRRLRKGSSCCGDITATDKKKTVDDDDKSHYPYSIELSVSGMMCVGCKTKVENALNSIDGVLANVDLNNSTAYVRCKNRPDERQLRSAVAKAGYSAKVK